MVEGISQVVVNSKEDSRHQTLYKLVIDVKVERHCLKIT